MSDARWKRIDQLLQSALGHPPHEREAFVREACADDEGVRDEVLSLLAHAGSSDKFLELPPAREPLPPGARLGAYEIRAQIGEGGMGEVYRAHDGRLRRDIALKILPPEAADAERRHRFAREAQAVAALNHPGIVTIHSVEQSGDIHFLTMELVDGQTLDVLTPAGGLPIDRLLALAIPLADAVGAAHGQGIVHRDLKPANVMVTRDGRVKVMDFGLAKLSRRATFQDAKDASVTTIAGRLTEDGRIFGTVAYMSPEQAEGRDVDHRSDVFSLGVLLFELATGRRPFTGESQVALLASIVKDTPPPVTEFKRELPADFARVVRKCLAKEAHRRYQSVLDLRNDLEELQQNPSTEPTTTGFGSATWRRRRRVAIGMAASIIVAGVACYVLWPTSHTETPAGEFQRHTIQPPSGVRIRGQDGRGSPLLAISPDGRWIAFTGDAGSERRGLYLHLTTELESRRIRDESSGSPFFSSDSRWLGFWSNDKLWKVPVAGGDPEPICEVQGELRGASWGDDNSIVYSAGGGHLFRVSSEGGTPEQITRPGADDLRFRFPHVLPGSKSALVRLVNGEAQLTVVSIPGGKIINPLSLDGKQNWFGSSPQYVGLNGGWLVFRRLTRLYAAPFDLDRLNVTGDARQVFDGVSYNTGGSETSAFAVSRNGALIYVPPQERVETAQLTWLNRSGDEEPAVKERQDYGWPTLDPNGERIAVHITKSGDGDLSVYDLRTGAWRVLTHGLATSRAMAWTGNGKWIVFSSAPSGIPRLYRVLADEGEPKQLTAQAEYGEFRTAYDVATSAHGNVASFFRQVSAADFDLLTVQVDPPGPAIPFLKKDFRVFDGQISPDGRWIAYVSQPQANAEEEVVVRSFQEAAQRVPIGRGNNPRWSRDGRQLFFRRGLQLLSVSFPEVGMPQGVLTFPADADFGRAEYGVAPGGRFLFTKRPPPARTEQLLVGVPNWIAVVRAAYSTAPGSSAR